MSAEVFDGFAFSEGIYEGLRSRVLKLKARGIVPGLAVIYGKGVLPAESYVRAKIKASAKAGVSCGIIPMRASDSERDYVRTIQRVLKDKETHGLILVKPFPERVNPDKLESLTSPDKDVEGLGAFHFGKFFMARRFEEIEEEGLIVPATALAIAEIARKSIPSLKGKKALVVGRSNIVGSPAAHLLTMMDVTVTLSHSKTKNLKKEVHEADIVVSAVGRPHLIHGSWIKKGAVIIDAGTSSVRGKLTGDVDLNGALKKAALVTPIPGGVGPVTAALLLRNVVSLAERRLP